MTGKTFVLILLLVTVLRGIMVSFEEISPSEAYYELCARQPAPAYFDGPPGLMAMAALGHMAGEGRDDIWRLWAPLWAMLASLACFLLVRAMRGTEIAAWTALALNVLPIVNYAAVRVRPELPALTLVLLALWLGWRAMKEEDRAVWYWLGAAGCLALATQFLYASLVVVPGLVVFALAVRRPRIVDVAGAVLLVGVPLLALIPAFRWNAGYEWIPMFPGTFRSWWAFGLDDLMVGLARLADKFSPFLLVLLVAAVVGVAREVRSNRTSRFVACVAFPLVVGAIYLAMRGRDPVFLLLLAMPLLLFKLVERATDRWVWRMVLAAAVLLALGGSWVSVRRAFAAGEGWRAQADEVREVFAAESSAGHEGIFLIAGDVSLTSIMGYHLRHDLIPPEGHPTVYEVESQDISSQFGLWPSYDDFVESERVVDEFFTEQKGENPFVGRSAIYISREPPEEIPQAVSGAFESVTLLNQGPAVGGGPVYLYFCLNYQTLPL